MTRDHILTAAIECFAQRGPACPVSEIAKNANVNEVTIYRHFGTRHNLYLEAFREAANRNPMLPYLRRVIDMPVVPALPECMGELVRIVLGPGTHVFRMALLMSLLDHKVFERWFNDPTRGTASGTVFQLIEAYVGRLQDERGMLAGRRAPEDWTRIIWGHCYGSYIRNVLLGGRWADKDPIATTRGFAADIELGYATKGVQKK